MTFWSSLSTADFGAAVQALMPRGRAWPRFAGTVQQAVAQAVGDCLFAFHALCALWLDTESFPDTAQQCLPDWETDYGLPDSCSPAGATVLQRRTALMAKIAASPGGQTMAYYIGVAAALGYTITITTWPPFTFGSAFGGALVGPLWNFAWRVNAPTITVKRFTFGTSHFGEPFWTIDNTELQCRLGKIAPAYGVLWFQYS
jgi:uncharacterized protein YmfQ (DUF2313 family)